MLKLRREDYASQIEKAEYLPFGKRSVRKQKTRKTTVYPSSAACLPSQVLSVSEDSFSPFVVAA